MDGLGLVSFISIAFILSNFIFLFFESFKRLCYYLEKRGQQ